MLNILSVILGIVGLVLALIGLVPFLGWTNWIWLIVPVIGAGLGLLSRGRTGFRLNLFVGAVMVVRLIFGGGVL
ncbi:hypothetical protein [Sphingomicrobium astaxanthinifaciens]|uniref:hypothetical protein n=1 Tax=Sphingomicrobium astaxanthinifaciens TaxID=1227949 RepID=UPI001FCA9B91|nr:hypothetical protein [Sphingomicrobium astaxanthinifaciens]MCJ7420852.1 hypothetical protein [Sphingomicrobium astaxanthinifaciens]